MTASRLWCEDFRHLPCYSAETIEEGRDQCECLSSQEVSKTIRTRTVSNQLTDRGSGGDCFGGDSESIDVHLLYHND
jgi:hypothetical protein